MNTVPPQGHYRITGAALISVDPVIGTRTSADVEIRAGRIVDVGDHVPAPGAEVIDGRGMILMPGMVETHFHMWSTVGRNFVSEGHEYFDAKHATRESYEPGDYHDSVRLGLVEALNAGITTVHNWDHNVLSPAHVDAQLEAHAEVGVRARYSYGFRDLSPDSSIDFADVDRVRAQWFAPGSPLEGLVHLGVNVRLGTDADQFLAQIVSALERGLPLAVHNGQTDVSTVSAAQLEEWGVLSPGFLLCHGLAFDDDDYAAMARTSASMSFSPHSEMRLGSAGGFHRQLMHMPARGLNVALSVDAASLGPVDLFEAMRIMWNLGVPWSGTDTAALPALLYGQVIAMATLNGARALGIDTEVGSITPGKKADLVMIRQDDLNMAPTFDLESAVVRCAHVHNVDTVMLDGRVVKRGGALVGFDVADIVRRAQRASESVRSRAGGRFVDAPTHATAGTVA